MGDLEMTTFRFTVQCFALAGLTLFLSAGCGGVSADQACTDQAKAQCNKLDTCRKNGTQLTYGTLGACITRLKANCMTALMAPSAGNSPGSVESCAQALPMESCQDYLQGNTTDACVAKNGNLDGGAACAFSTQCKSGFCAVAKNTNCGVCQNPPAVGDPCTDIGCGRNLVCTPNQICAAYVASGGMCDTKNLVCAPGFGCVIATGQTTGTCKQKGQTVGAACDPKSVTAPICDANQGLFCNNMTNQCAAQTYGNDGQTCGNTGTADVVCNAGGSCINPGSGSGAACVAAADAGASCDTAMGPPCLAPARCVVSPGGTSGMCMTLDGSMCM
jgi:hypothetical protein